MQNKYILITGVSGLLGKAISKELSKTRPVVGIDIKPPQEDVGASFYQADLTDAASIRSALAKIAQERGDQIASVVHLAAYYDFTGAPSDMYEKLTVNGARQLIRKLKELDFSCEQFLFTSTHLVMKPVEKGELIEEGDSLQADWDYPQSKIEAEQVLREELEEIPSVIFRVSGVYDEEGHSPPICNQIQRIYEKSFISHFYPGDQEKGQPFIHLQDLTEAVRLAVDKRNEFAREEIFFIAEPELLSYGELQDRIGMLIYGRNWKTFRAPKAVAKAGAHIMNKQEDSTFIKPWMIDLTEAHYPLSQKRANEILGFYPKRRLYEALPQMIHNLQENPQRWYRANKLGEPPEPSLERRAN